VVRAIYPDFQEERKAGPAISPNESGWFGLAKANQLVFRAPGQDSTIPLRGLDFDTPVRFAPKGGAVPGERIVGIRKPGEGITVYPIHSPALIEFDDKPELWLDVRWDLDKAKKSLFPTQILVTTLNEPGALGVVATTIGETGANIDSVVFNPSAPDFREIRFDLEVSDIQHLNAVIAQLRDKPFISKVERISG
jgi:GTP pyrophosphokinase